ncbi:MAG: hypothetical protein HYY06_04945, partial [Deltaproteobacteria bacterium]|nr:hypothetical protein [Deltaproteobacteria bacterium]
MAERIFVWCAALAAMSCALPSGGLERSGAAATPKGPTLFIMAERDPGLIAHFRSLQASEDVRFVGVQWAASPDPDPGAQQAAFEEAVRRELDALNEPGPEVSVVFSGHSMGYDFWGDLGYVKARPTSLGESGFFVSDLAEEYPLAFDRVRSVHLLGCNTGRQVNLDIWGAVFPRARSLVGFWQSGGLGSAAWRVYLDSRTVLTAENVEDAARVEAWLHSTGWSYVAIRLDPEDGEPSFMVSREDLYGDCTEPEPDCENTYEGMSFDAYEQNKLAYESYFMAVPGFEDPAASDAGGGPIRRYYNGVYGLGDVYCRRADDPACPRMQREVETSQRLNHFANVKAWWLTTHYAELEAIQPGLAATLAYSTGR